MARSLFSAAILFGICVNAMTLPYNAPDDKAMELEGVTDDDPTVLLAAAPAGGAFPQKGWVITVDSEQANLGKYNVMDGNNKTYWHSQYSPTLANLPHTLTIDMKELKYVDGITYTPRQDGSKNGNIGQHSVYTSTDGVNL